MHLSDNRSNSEAPDGASVFMRETSHRFNIRLILACTMALAVSFPMAIISISKALLLLGGLVLLLAGIGNKSVRFSRSREMWSGWAIAIALAVMGLSVLWTTTSLGNAGQAWVKHAKLLLIPLLVVLLRTRREAAIALTFFLAGQGLVLLISWLQVFHVHMPFPTQASPGWEYLVFAGHLDQPIMTSIAAALLWHLRSEIGLAGNRGLLVVLCVLAAAFINVLVVQIGRTGYIVAMGMTGLAIYWSIPAKAKIGAVAAALALVLGIGVVSPKVRHGMEVVWQESSNYEQSGNIDSSSGERLNYWRRSLQAYAQSPVIGYGVGSWNMQYNRMEGGRANDATWRSRNPHDEFLLWMVELGTAGLVLVIAVFAAIFRDSGRMAQMGLRTTRSLWFALLLSCLVNATIFDAQIGDFFCVALGLTMALGVRSLPDSEPHATTV